MPENLLTSSTEVSSSTESISTEPVIPFTPPQWATGLNVDHEILKAPMFNSIKTIDDVVKGYHSAQKMIGADKIVIPNKNSSSDEWRNFYVKGGLPDKFDDYKVEMPASFDDANFNGELLKAAYDNNIRPDQLQRIMTMIDKSNSDLVSGYEASQAEALKATAAELRQEWGQGFAKQIATANRVIKHFGGEEVHKQIAGSDLANNKDFLKLMANIGSKMTSEDSFTHEAIGTFGMTKEEARSKMNAIYGDANSPYFNNQHAQNKEFLERMLKYQEILA